MFLLCRCFCFLPAPSLETPPPDHCAYASRSLSLRVSLSLLLSLSLSLKRIIHSISHYSLPTHSLLGVMVNNSPLFCFSSTPPWDGNGEYASCIGMVCKKALFLQSRERNKSCYCNDRCHSIVLWGGYTE